jgi:hypothetical protein
MHLVPCARPSAVECAAPRCSLADDGGVVRWDAFWGADDAYYARATHVASGEERWFRIADDAERLAERVAATVAVEATLRTDDASDPAAATRIAVVPRAPRPGAPAPLMLIGSHSRRRGRTVMWVRPARA